MRRLPATVAAAALVLVASACGVGLGTAGGPDPPIPPEPDPWVTTTTTEDWEVGTTTTTEPWEDPTTTTTTEAWEEPTTTTTEAPPEEEFSEYAWISTWYSDGVGYGSAWLHFKTVDPDGYTVLEVLGSDNIDLDDEVEVGPLETPARRALVDELRQMMADDGWTELGVDGLWYEYMFGR